MCALSWKRKDNLCTYTRELTVDLPDLEGADLSDQGDEELCENCGRPMVLKKGRSERSLLVPVIPIARRRSRSAVRRRRPISPG